MTRTRGLGAVLGVLLATGWAANHFAAVIPVLASEHGLSHTLLDGVFGVYAVGLLPGLFGGGALSDRLGRPRVVLPGAALAAVGTLVLLAWQDPPGLLLGRLVVGLGAGLAFGAGTAWAADLGGTTGTVLAGVALTSGFAVGPLASGLLAQWGPAPLHVPFVVSAGLSLLAVAVAVRSARAAPPRPGGSVTAPPEGPVGPALAWSLPVAVLVFASATTTLVTLPARLPSSYAGPLLVGLAATLTLGTGIVVQTLARRGSWGPRAGVVGALLSAAGYALTAIGGAEVGPLLMAVVCLLMGSAYGLCLREGLLDVETLAPAARRGLLTGVFYVVTYLGFGQPLLLELLRPRVGVVAPALVLAGIGVLAAATRSLQLRRGHPVR